MRIKYEARPAIRKEIRKILPYSITPIGGIAELKQWKADQARKQDEWDAGRSTRYEAAKERAVDVLFGANPTSDKNLRAGQAYSNIKALTADGVTQTIEKTKEIIMPPKRSIWEKATEWFLNINFGR